MKLENGLVFGAVAVAFILLWFHSRRAAIAEGTPQVNVVTEDAGGIPPFVPSSNSPLVTGDDWTTPYYLRANYPTDRGGMGVVPSITVGDTGEFFNPQRINPQF